MSDIESAKAVLYIELAKPPAIQDLARHVEEPPRQSGAVLELPRDVEVKLAGVKSVGELDGVIRELFARDLESVRGFLPAAYSRFLDAIVEVDELELLYSKLASKSLEERRLHYAKLHDYSECIGVDKFSCIISRRLSRLRSSCSEVREDCDRALGVVALLDALLYTRYHDNLKALKLVTEATLGDISLKELVNIGLGHLGGAGSIYFESGLARIEEALRDKSDPVKSWCRAILALYEVARNALYYTNTLVDLVALYGVDRLLKYRLLKIIYSRRLKPW